MGYQKKDYCAAQAIVADQVPKIAINSLNNEI